MGFVLRALRECGLHSEKPSHASRRLQIINNGTAFKNSRVMQFPQPSVDAKIAQN